MALKINYKRDFLLDANREDTGNKVSVLCTCPSTSALSVIHLRKGNYHFSEHFGLASNKSRGEINLSYFYILKVLRSGKRVSEKEKEGQSECVAESEKKIHSKASEAVRLLRPLINHHIKII